MQACRQRKKTPKVRSGCVTCKKRRVKCDEAKPSCNRCTSTGRKCEGYNTPVAKIFELSRKPNTVILPAITVNELSVYNGSSEEKRSLQYYLENIAFATSTQPDSRRWFWASFLPQAAQESGIVRHAITSVALSDEAITSDSTLTNLDERRDYHYHAGVAMLIRQRPPLEILLSACIMLWVVGWYQRDVGSSYVHISSAKKMIEEYKQSPMVSRNPHHNVIINLMEPMFDERLEYMEESFSQGHDKFQLPRPYKVFRSFLDAQQDLINIILGFSDARHTRRVLVVQLEAWHEAVEMMPCKPPPFITGPTFVLYRVAIRAALLSTSKSDDIWRNVRLAWILKQLQSLMQVQIGGLHDGIAKVLSLIRGTAQDWQAFIKQVDDLTSQLEMTRYQCRNAEPVNSRHLPQRFANLLN